ncbi:MCE family protein [Nocardioides humilatus]|uniref:MCE family protein n=1 Tax=Nocardioides humilatus TaxID=2607660 RepID=A0A5B1LK89_9ACTN|nr:MCE family protein [Nocardioides humilatus]KAA1420973.1 MCE family protein [Nocardioides humilatus]
MIARIRGSRAAVVVLVVGLVAAAFAWQGTRGGDTKITVYFSSASAVYEGNPVQVLGVPVGTVESVTPEPGRVKVVLNLDSDVTLPADVQAFQVSPSLISGRSIELAPAYESGPRLADGAVIPVERSQVPLDINDLYSSAQELTSALGPDGANKRGSLTRALDVLASNLDGNGDSLAAAISGLADASGTLAGSREDITGTVRGLQTFTSTLAGNDAGVRHLNRQLATVSGFLATDRGELGAALQQLAVTLDDVAGFVRDNRELVRHNVSQLTRVTKVLVRNRQILGSIFDEAPAGLGNLLNAYDAAGGTLDVRMDVNELSLAPGAFLCELLARGAPGDVPPALLSLCSNTVGSLGGSIPTLAELLAAMQGGVQ